MNREQATELANRVKAMMLHPDHWNVVLEGHDAHGYDGFIRRSYDNIVLDVSLNRGSAAYFAAIYVPGNTNHNDRLAHAKSDTPIGAVNAATKAYLDSAQARMEDICTFMREEV